ncbi:MAG: hypothetical protein LAO08_01615 [Acidobacteriia bacterium]|nr:hypothetical protein [Terriglobia bacterium]
MKLFKVLTAIGSLFLLGLMLTPGLQAGNDSWNRKTKLKFSQPFEIPGGQILAAGTYVFKLLDSPRDRHIVQIFNEDETKVYATILAIPNYRVHAPENTIINFEERTSGSPQAIKAWFHPGDTLGHEFVYPKARAVELAKLTNEPVPSMPTELTPAITSRAPVAELRKAPIKAEEPTGEEVAISEAFAPVLEATVLPKTASSMPLVGLIGLMSLVVAFTLLIVTKRIS